MVRSEPSDVDVSVVIAAWRCADLVGGAVRSALDQAGVSVEVVVCDDASGDGTADAARVDGDPRVRVLTQPRNGGPGAARNSAIAQARGRWIAVLDADDRFLPGRLERLLGRGARCDVVVDNLLVSRGDAASGRPLFPAGGGERVLTLAEFTLSNRLFASALNLGYLKPVIRRAFLERCAVRYDEEPRIGEDYVFLAECLAAGGRALLIETPGYLYRVDDGSLSARISPAQIEAMLCADAALLARRPFDDPAAQAAQRSRTASLRAGLAFTRAVDALKARDVGGVLRALRAEPRALALFRMPLAARLARLAGRRVGR